MLVFFRFSGICHYVFFLLSKKKEKKASYRDGRVTANDSLVFVTDTWTKADLGIER